MHISELNIKIGFADGENPISIPSAAAFRTYDKENSSAVSGKVQSSAELQCGESAATDSFNSEQLRILQMLEKKWRKSTRQQRNKDDNKKAADDNDHEMKEPDTQSAQAEDMDVETLHNGNSDNNGTQFNAANEKISQDNNGYWFEGYICANNTKNNAARYLDTKENQPMLDCVLGEDVFHLPPTAPYILRMPFLDKSLYKAEFKKKKKKEHGNLHRMNLYVPVTKLDVMSVVLQHAVDVLFQREVDSLSRKNLDDLNGDGDDDNVRQKCVHDEYDILLILPDNIETNIIVALTDIVLTKLRIRTTLSETDTEKTSENVVDDALPVEDKMHHSSKIQISHFRSVAIHHASVAACMAQSLTTGLVVDVDAQMTNISAVLDGTIISNNHNMLNSPMDYGMLDMQQFLLRLIKRDNLMTYESCCTIETNESNDIRNDINKIYQDRLLLRKLLIEHCSCDGKTQKMDKTINFDVRRYLQK